MLDQLKAKMIEYVKAERELMALQFEMQALELRYLVSVDAERGYKLNLNTMEIEKPEKGQ